jgi:hypothetical protein
MLNRLALQEEMNLVNSSAPAAVAALAQLRAELQHYNRSLIPDQVQGCDLKACPTNFNPPAWMPWLAKSPPLPTPPPPGVSAVHSSVSSGDWAAHGEGSSLGPAGWVCDLSVPAKGAEPCVVTMVLDKHPVATMIANITRSGVVPNHCPNTEHGFAFNLLKSSVVTGAHTVAFTIEDHLDGRTVTLGTGPRCFNHGKTVPC